MSEEIQTEVSEPSPVFETASLGAKLRAAREELGMDIDEVCRQLCLSPRQVMALEADEFDALPSPTFARGFIRNYARLLHLDAEQLLTLYRGKIPEKAQNGSISLHSEGIPIQVGSRTAWLPYLIASIVLILAAGAWWFYMDWRDRQPAQQPSSETKNAPVATPMPLPQSSPSQTSEPPPMGVGKQPSELVQPPAVQTPTESAPVPAAAPAGSRILLKFSQSSWVRVQDADGKDLINKTNPADSEETIEGKPPFKLTIGNATGAQLIYNNQPVDLAPHIKGNVARLTLE